MEHACAQCGAKVEDGTPFCPGCGAPQIRVSVRTEDLPPGPPAGEPAAAPSPLHPAQFQAWVSRPGTSGRVVWHAALPGCLAAGLLSGLGMMIPSLPVIAIFMIAGGGLAVTLYRRREHLGEVTAPQGFRIGALTGFIGALLVSAISIIGYTSADNRALLQKALQEKLQEAAAGNPDPQAQQAVQRLGEMLAGPHGLTTILAFGLFVMLVLFLVLSGAGGALGARLFGKHPPRV